MGWAKTCTRDIKSEQPRTKYSTAHNRQDTGGGIGHLQTNEVAQNDDPG